MSEIEMNKNVHVFPPFYLNSSSYFFKYIYNVTTNI